MPDLKKKIKKFFMNLDIKRALWGKRTFLIWPSGSQGEEEGKKERLAKARMKVSQLYGINYGSYLSIGKVKNWDDESKTEKRVSDISDEDPRLKTISEITKESKYKREYVGYLIRQKKIKAKKINGVWKTTLEWVKEFEKEAEERKEKMRKKMSERLNGKETKKEEKLPEKYSEGERINFRNEYVRAATALISIVMLLAVSSITEANFENLRDRAAKKILTAYNAAVEKGA